MSPTKVGNLSWKCNGIDPHFSGMLQIQISPKQSFPTKPEFKLYVIIAAFVDF